MREDMDMTDKDWNWDRMFSVLSMMHSVQDDLARTMHRGSINSGVKKRMVKMLRDCADDIDKMRETD